jgi:sugar lactone lactonase YvrE
MTKRRKQKEEIKMRYNTKYLRFPKIIMAVILFLILSGPGLAGEITVLDPQYEAFVLAEDTPMAGCNGAVIGADGALYVVHSANGMVTRIDLKTMKAAPAVAPYAGLFITDDITSDDKGNLYITGTTPLVGKVYRVSPNGIKKVIAKGLTAPNGIQYNLRTGRLFVTECFQANRVFEIDPAGVKEPRLMIKENVISVPEGFDFDRETDDLIVPDLGTGKILRIHPDTAAITTIAEKFVTPIALKVGPDNMAYIVELATGSVYRLSLDGRKRDKLAQIMPGLDNLAITPEGRLFVTSYWDATIFEVATDGSGKYQTLFPMGPNQLLGIALAGDKILVADAIMIRSLEHRAYVKTKLNAWATSGMPLPLGLAAGPAGQLFWPDCVHGAVAIGNPITGEFKPVAGELNQPMAVFMDPSGASFYVAEYGSGQVREVSLTDGAKKVVAGGLAGPIALTMVDGKLYVAETKAGRISKVDPATGDKEVFCVAVAGRPNAIGNDGSGNLLFLDGGSQKLYRLNTRNMALSVVAEDLPVGYSTVGSYPPTEFPWPMAVDSTGNIYLATLNRGMIIIQKK